MSSASVLYRELLKGTHPPSSTPPLSVKRGVSCFLGAVRPLPRSDRTLPPPRNVKQCEQRITSLWRKVLRARRQFDYLEADRLATEMDQLVDYRAFLIRRAEQQARERGVLNWTGRGGS